MPSSPAPPASPLFADRADLATLLAAALDESVHFLDTAPNRRIGTIKPHAEVLPAYQYPGNLIGRGTQLAFDTDFGEGQGALKTLRHFIRRYDDYICGSTTPRYLGYVTGGVTPAALVGDWLASVYDQNPQGLRWFGDASARIEHKTIHLLQDLLGLDRSFNGGFVTGATVSNFTCLGVARQWAGRRLGIDVARDGMSQRIPVLTATPHSSAVKALAMLGMGRASIVEVATLPGREAMDVGDLAKQAASLGDRPFIVVASAGTVNTADFDDFQAILRLRDRHPFWLHIDGAFGGFANLAGPPVRRDLLEGWTQADSITVDNHKWLNVPYDSGTWFVKKEHEKLQVEAFKNGNAPYLDGPHGHFNYLNLGPENSRRLRALPVWFTIRAYGKPGYRDIVKRCVDSAFGLAEKIVASEEFELLAPVRLNVVAFTLSGKDDPATIDRFAQLLNNNGRYFLTPTTLFGRRGLRAAFVNWQASRSITHHLFLELRATFAQLTFAPAAPPTS
ncbi:hypothetical protein LEM8419_02165 [Neolewinella maritima]|uniref:Aspartate aminotransferase family protein n=1 Tax=Neolewinella maritima TaxID=1383882 RepID=A0ABM9B248_9BACT|nr:pyridoxal-dependent decarboxylase [Neolewinella maritima]CAH1001265.1 hypothetical protein LEM8419_02165 [Neolewinella maritima]